MAKRRYTAEEIVTVLRQVEVAIANGKTTPQVLAPAIVESICTGRQGLCLSAERLKTQTGVPIEWDAQQRLLAD
jgi:hypothetical protein